MAANLAGQISGTMMVEFFQRAGRLGENFDLQLVKRLLGDDVLMSWWLKQLDRYRAQRLVHGLYHLLSDKLEKVRSWPGVTGAMLDAALKEAAESGRIARFEAESPGHRGLDIVVSPYLDDAPETLVYAIDRLKETFSDSLWPWHDAYGGPITKTRVRYLQDEGGRTVVPVHRNCVRIEVVDLFANWNRRKPGLVVSGARNANSAHFAVLYAAAQDPDWVLVMDGRAVPYAIVGGLEMDAGGCDPWTLVPDIRQCAHQTNLGCHDCASPYSYAALPSLRE